VENHFSNWFVRAYFWTESYDFKIMALIIRVIFRGGGLKINLEDILLILSKNYKWNDLLNYHDHQGEYYGQYTPM
jgi:hypothetical protein